MFTKHVLVFILIWAVFRSAHFQAFAGPEDETQVCAVAAEALTQEAAHQIAVVEASAGWAPSPVGSSALTKTADTLEARPNKADASQSVTQSTRLANDFVFGPASRPIVVSLKRDVTVVPLPPPPPGGSLTKQIEEVAKAHGLDISLDRFTKKVRWQKAPGVYEEFEAPVEGGMREIYRDKKTGRFYKRLKDQGPGAADAIAREIVITEFTNKFFANAHHEIGIGLSAAEHDYTLAKHGWVSQEEVQGMTWDSYKKSLSSEELKYTLEAEDKLRSKLSEANKMAGRMVNKKFKGEHYIKGLAPEDVQKLRTAFRNDADTYVDFLAERGFLANVDTGLLRGAPDDLNNCLVEKVVIIRGKKVPMLKCFDIG